MTIAAWTIPGSDAQPIYGNTHLPPDSVTPRGVLILCHGFKGYKDYGFLPILAHHAAKRGLIVHRFNFSHSGMNNHVDTFAHPELFEKDTWSRQVYDLLTVSRESHIGDLPSPAKPTGPLPQIWFGHSRGGVTTLLAAARKASPGEYESAPSMNNPSARQIAMSAPDPAAVIAASSPHYSCGLDDMQKRILHKQGFIESPSGRTKQALRVGVDWLSEIESLPNMFDPVFAAERLACPLCVIHGDEDMTVSDESSNILANAATSHAKVAVQKHIIPGATHVFNTRNPADIDEPLSPQAAQMIEAVCDFSLRCTESA